MRLIINRSKQYCYTSSASDLTIFGDDLASTEVTKPEVHVERADKLVNHSVLKVFANDENYALAA